MNENARYVAERFSFAQRFPSIFTICKLSVTIFIVAHFAGCGFHKIGVYEIEINKNRSWLNA